MRDKLGNIKPPYVYSCGHPAPSWREEFANLNCPTCYAPILAEAIRILAAKREAHMRATGKTIRQLQDEYEEMEAMEREN